MSAVVRTLPFREDGSFRILQLTDLHLITTERPKEFQETLSLIQKAVEDTAPDLIAITGDLTWGETMDDLDAMNALAETLEKCKVPWAPVLGNHDGDKIGRNTFADMLLDRPYSLFTLGETAGHGNYIVSVSDEWYLYFLDSHTGEFLPEQLDWYRGTASALPESHNQLAFFHVPFPEFLEVWDYEPCKGINMEAVCSTKLNDGLFSAFVRNGHMRGVFVGHDHVNDFEGTLHGIRLCYGRATGYQCYGFESMPRGARIIDLKKGEQSFETSIYLATGEVYKQERESVPVLRRKR